MLNVVCYVNAERLLKYVITIKSSAYLWHEQGSEFFRTLADSLLAIFVFEIDII